MRAQLDSKMERAEMRMIRWTCGVSLKEGQSSSEQGRIINFKVWMCLGM